MCYLEKGHLECPWVVALLLRAHAQESSAISFILGVDSLPPKEFLKKDKVDVIYYPSRPTILTLTAYNKPNGYSYDKSPETHFELEMSDYYISAILEFLEKEALSKADLEFKEIERKERLDRVKEHLTNRLANFS